MSKKIDPILLKVDKDFRDDSHEALISWCEDVLEQFLESSSCSSWNENKKDIACFFIHGFINYAYCYHLAKPFQYNAAIIEEMCLDILPRKMKTDKKDFKQMASIFITFFEWCENMNFLKNTLTIRNKLKIIDHKIYDVMKKNSSWSMVKSFFSGIWK